MSTTVLVNNSKRRLVISLAHPAFLRKRYGFSRVEVRTYEHDRKTGKRGIREVAKGCPGSLTLLVGSRSQEFPNQIAAVHDVKKFVAAGMLRLEELKPDAPKKAPAADKPKADKSTTKAASGRATK